MKIRLIALTACFLYCIALHACTGIIRKAHNGDVIFARTLEFGADLLKTELSFIPRGYTYSTTLPDGQSGLKWDNQYAVLGFSPFSTPLIMDGINEAGLACGAFYFPGWATFQTLNPTRASDTLSNLNLPAWILGNFTKVQDVLAALQKVDVCSVILPEWGFSPPLHYIIVDETDTRAVLEYINGSLKVYDGSLGVITNSPSYDWHVTHARNYIGLRALNAPNIHISGKEFSQFGQGSGAIGLPGDFTPPSRFIRAAFLNAVTDHKQNGQEEVSVAFTILNQFDIPKGAVREKQEDRMIEEVTQWTSASDLAGRRYFFHTQDNRTIRMVDFSTLPINGKDILRLDVSGTQAIPNLSNAFR